MKSLPCRHTVVVPSATFFPACHGGRGARWRCRRYALWPVDTRTPAFQLSGEARAIEPDVVGHADNGLNMRCSPPASVEPIPRGINIEDQAGLISERIFLCHATPFATVRSQRELEQLAKLYFRPVASSSGSQSMIATSRLDIAGCRPYFSGPVRPLCSRPGWWGGAVRPGLPPVAPQALGRCEQELDRFSSKGYIY
jgi:hypothetical protein